MALVFRKRHVLERFWRVSIHAEDFRGVEALNPRVSMSLVGGVKERRVRFLSPPKQSDDVPL